MQIEVHKGRRLSTLNDALAFDKDTKRIEVFQGISLVMLKDRASCLAFDLVFAKS